MILRASTANVASVNRQAGAMRKSTGPVGSGVAVSH
jgi:hypothetical protein